MNIIVISAGLVALFVFPLVTYSVMWFTSRQGETERPEPPETNRTRRTIPGHNSDN
jgi:hypothetical protein